MRNDGDFSQWNPVFFEGNAPLDFELKGLDAEHPYLLSRGFTPETIEQFGLGLASQW